jgi:hypothetical protein
MFRLPDTRSDLGIARLGKTPRIHDMVGADSWPYTDEYEEFSYSDKELETKSIIDKRQISPINDYGDMTGMDRSAMHDIIKVEAVASGLSPFPNMYKNREGHLGRSAKSIANTHAFGFYFDDDASGHNYKSTYDEDEDKPAYSLEDIALNQLRECIRLMLKEVYYEQV